MELGVLAGRLAYYVRRINHQIGSRVSARFQSYGLKPGAFTTMALISANPGCSQVDIARVSDLDKTALVAIVDELETRGLAIRGRSVSDRRRNTLTLSPEGQRLVDEMFALANEVEDPFRDELTAAERTILFSLLERVTQVYAEDE
jgi:DNA-binding MarR family transcriptional regulator